MSSTQLQNSRQAGFSDEMACNYCQRPEHWRAEHLQFSLLHPNCLVVSIKAAPLSWHQAVWCHACLRRVLCVVHGISLKTHSLLLRILPMEVGTRRSNFSASLRMHSWRVVSSSAVGSGRKGTSSLSKSLGMIVAKRRPATMPPPRSVELSCSAELDL